MAKRTKTATRATTIMTTSFVLDRGAARVTGAPQLEQKGERSSTGFPHAEHNIRLRAVYSISPLHANHLPQRMDDLHKIGLGCHHCFYWFVGRRGFVDHIRVLPALHAFRHPCVIFHREPALGLVARHRAPGSVTATAEALRVAFAADDVRTRAHAAGNDSHVALARTHRAFARHQYVLAEVRLARHIVVMTVDGLHFPVERRNFARAGDG